LGLDAVARAPQWGGARRGVEFVHPASRARMRRISTRPDVSGSIYRTMAESIMPESCSVAPGNGASIGSRSRIASSRGATSRHRLA
jgi:hypothetical protein